MQVDRLVRPDALAGLLEAFKSLAIRTLILGGYVLLLGLYFNLNNNRPGIQIIDLPASLIVGVSLAMLGWRALTVTTFDYFLVAWLVLVIGSHIFAVGVLGRDLPDRMLMVTVGIVISMGLMYRAVFCLTLLSPKASTWAFFITLTGILVGAAILGLMERFGPGRALAMSISSHFAPQAQVTAIPTSPETADAGRPTSIFEGPNLLGYADLVLSCLALGWATAKIRTIDPWHVIAVMSVIGIGALSALASQSRLVIILIVLLVMAFGVMLRTRSQKPSALWTYVGVLSVTLLAMVAVLQSGRFEYLTQVKRTGIEHDPSFEFRKNAIAKVAQMATDIAPLGSGVSDNNNPNLEYNTGFSKYSSLGIDNEWVHSFLAHGVWGPLWMALLFIYWYRECMTLRKTEIFEAKVVMYTGFIFLLITLILSPGATRVFKYETSGYIFAVLGCLAAWKYLIQQGAAKPLLSGAG